MTYHRCSSGTHHRHEFTVNAWEKAIQKLQNLEPGRRTGPGERARPVRKGERRAMNGRKIHILEWVFPVGGRKWVLSGRGDGVIHT